MLLLLLSLLLFNFLAHQHKAAARLDKQNYAGNGNGLLFCERGDQ